MLSPQDSGYLQQEGKKDRIEEKGLPPEALKVSTRNQMSSEELKLALW